MVTLQILPWRNANGPIGLCNIAMEGVDWKLLVGRYICKFGECRKFFVAKRLFCKHVDKDHFFIMATSRFSCLLTCKEDPTCLDHIIMNACILGNPYKCHKWNEAKSVDHAKKKNNNIIIGCKLKHVFCETYGSMVHKILGM
jgi:hypothetical protein